MRFDALTLLLRLTHVLQLALRCSRLVPSRRRFMDSVEILTSQYTLASHEQRVLLEGSRWSLGRKVADLSKLEITVSILSGESGLLPVNAQL